MEAVVPQNQASPVAGSLIVQDAPAETLRYPSCKEIIQKFLMGNLASSPTFPKRDNPVPSLYHRDTADSGGRYRQRAGTDRLHLAFKSLTSFVAAVFQMAAMVVTL